MVLANPRAVILLPVGGRVLFSTCLVGDPPGMCGGRGSAGGEAAVPRSAPAALVASITRFRVPEVEATSQSLALSEPVSRLLGKEG